MSSSAGDDGLPTVSVQKQLISADLNSTLVFLFLMGMYTAIFMATIHIYLLRRPGQSQSPSSHVVTISLTTLYATLVVQTSVQWLYTNLAFCRGGRSRESIFISSATDPLPSIGVVGGVMQNLGFLLADGVIVWRCFHACGRSLLLLSIPMAFFVVEFALDIVEAALASIAICNLGFNTDHNLRTINIITGALYASMATTSITATLMISGSIYLKTSSALHTIVNILSTVANFLNTGNAVTSIKPLILSDYSQALDLVVTGLAPTLMVGRLAVLSWNQENILSEASSVELPAEFNNQGFLGQENNASSPVGVYK